MSFSVGGGTGKSNRSTAAATALGEISNFLTTVMEDADLVPSDIAVALMLLHYDDNCYNNNNNGNNNNGNNENNNDSNKLQKYQDIDYTDQEEVRLVSDIDRYSVHMEGIYGWVYYTYANPLVCIPELGLKSICPSSCCFGSKKGGGSSSNNRYACMYVYIYVYIYKEKLCIHVCITHNHDTYNVHNTNT